ncbi:sialate O-acetylesterase-like [Haliotis rubra]|uniref:sialate O-acetylesterase-like n=1 Tax=Haliotis rubra TaxID=36100 RepID=UPI001EE5D903|nr:sialate O-acetylesterase-like [Haliotis rubra]
MSYSAGTLDFIIHDISYFISSSVEAGSFSFSKSYANHMVLQQAPKKATIWGFASHVGETVTVQISGKGSVTTTTRHGDNGAVVWYAQLPPVSAGGPYTITATSREGKLTLSDVLFGDVWVCSGQSNMGFTMSMAFNATAEINDADNYPHIRLMTVLHHTSLKPETDFHGLFQSWSIASRHSVGGTDWVHFSALCWLYGKHLYKTLKYPIGLIATADGGTMDEAWSSPDALSKCLAPFRHWNVNSGWAILRWHQTADYGYVPNDRMKNTFMAVAMDLPDYNSPHGNIHPRDKADIAQRLYIEAMIVAYKRTDMLNQRGPFPTGFTEVVNKKTVQISYANTRTTIEKRNDNGFEVRQCRIVRVILRVLCPEEGHHRYPQVLSNDLPF